MRRLVPGLRVSSVTAMLGDPHMAPGHSVALYSSLLSRSLASPLPVVALATGFALRPCRGADDADAYVAMFNDAWAEHPDFSPLDRASFLHDVSAEDYDPELDLLVTTAAGELAGFCFAAVDDPGKASGIIQTIGVRPAFRKRGLGVAVESAGLHALRARGCLRTTLQVDSANRTGALALYLGLGFTLDGVEARYAKPLARCEKNIPKPKK